VEAVLAINLLAMESVFKHVRLAHIQQDKRPPSLVEMVTIGTEVDALNFVLQVKLLISLIINVNALLEPAGQEQVA
jgi:hypothetical protein